MQYHMIQTLKAKQDESGGWLTVWMHICVEFSPTTTKKKLLYSGHMHNKAQVHKHMYDTMHREIFSFRFFSFSVHICINCALCNIHSVSVKVGQNCTSIARKRHIIFESMQSEEMYEVKC